MTKKENKITGVTIIDHQIRTELELSCDEYVVIDMLYRWRKKYGKKIMKILSAENISGIAYPTLALIVQSLTEKKLITKTKGVKPYLIPADKWNKYFNVDEDFEEFWALWHKRGNKVTAKKAYEGARKVADKDTLHKAAKKMVEHVDELKYLPHAATWLNPSNRKWEDEILDKNEAEKPTKAKGDFLKTTD